MDYRLYHDESKIAGYWHGMLLVPETSRNELLDFLARARGNANYPFPLAIKKVKRSSGPVYRCAQSWILIAVGLMRTKLGQQTYPIHFAEMKEGRPVYDTLNKSLGLKFILFREKQGHQDMQLLNTYAQRVETTFRIGLKGGLHFLSSDEKPIHIIKMHFDGNEHHRGGIDKERIIGRLAGLRSSCSVLNSDDAIDDRCSDHNRSDSQDYKDCQLLQLTDLLVGSFRTFLGECTRDVHRTLAYAARLPIEAFARPYQGFRNSRWFGSFCMSQCEVLNGMWSYSTLEITETTDSRQLLLPM